MASVKGEVTIQDRLEHVWSVIGRFEDVSWIPAIESAEVVGEGVGEVRRVTLPQGVEVEERLVERDERSYAYTMPDDGPLPLKGYRGELSITPRDEACEVTWRATFEPDGAPEEEVCEQLRTIFQTALEHARDRIESRRV